MDNYNVLRYFTQKLKEVPERCGKCNPPCEFCLEVFERKCEILDRIQEYFTYELKDYNGGLCGFQFTDLNNASCEITKDAS